jgi:hypothetical protein
MESQFDIYLAGSMTGRSVGDVLNERAKAKELLKAASLTWYDPADNEGLDKLDKSAIISNAFDKPKMKAFVSKDLNAVSRCRAVLNITGDLPSEGSTWEMAYATFYRLIPVVLVAPERLKGSKMTFTNILVEGMFNTLEEAICHISTALSEPA